VNPAANPFAGTKRHVQGKKRDVGRTRGAFPEITEALRDAAPIIAYGRPYTPELWGWFDDFSHPGGYDALGGANRSDIIFNEASMFNDSPAQLRGGGRVLNGGEPGPAIGQYKKCPGSAEAPAADGSNIFSLGEQEALDCEEDARSTGNYAGSPYTRVGEGGTAPDGNGTEGP
jgi:phospholipid/cholesterol/gamma-HCH transport system substrate-binding protein